MTDQDRSREAHPTGQHAEGDDGAPLGLLEEALTSPTVVRTRRSQ